MNEPDNSVITGACEVSETFVRGPGQGIERAPVRVSYVITTKNRGRYLERALENVRQFIEPADELIIIDGGSTDETREIIDRNRDLITDFVSEPDEGEAHALNKALFRARGRYIKCITDDDYFYPDAMRTLIEVVEAHPEIDAVECGGEAWGVVEGEPIFGQLRFIDDVSRASPLSIFDQVDSGLGLIFRRDALMKTGGVSNNYVWVDGDLICRLIECGCDIRYLDIDLYRWYCYPHSGFGNGTRYRRIRHNQALISIRTERWANFAQSAAWLAESGVPREAQALLYWIWIAGLLARSPLRPVSIFLVAPVQSAARLSRQIKKVIREALRFGRGNTHPANTRERAWSGRLSPKYVPEATLDGH